MKILVSLFALLSVVVGSALAAGLDTAEALRAAVQEAVTRHNVAALRELYSTEGVTPADLAAAERPLNVAFAEGRDVTEVILTPLPPTFDTVMVAMGQRTELRLKPEGLISLLFSEVGATMTKSVSPDAISLPYARIGDHYVLLASQVTDLNWQGPRDRGLEYIINGPGQADVKVLVKWNASGVDLERETDAPFATILGQHFNEVLVTTTNPEATLTLTLRDKSGVIHISGPLKGAGELRYQRK